MEVEDPAGVQQAHKGARAWNQTVRTTALKTVTPVADIGQPGICFLHCTKNPRNPSTTLRTECGGKEKMRDQLRQEGVIRGNGSSLSQKNKSDRHRHEPEGAVRNRDG